MSGGWGMSPEDRGYKPSHHAGGRWDSPGSSSGNSDLGASAGLGWSGDLGDSRYGSRQRDTGYGGDSLFGGEPLFGDDGGRGGSGSGGWDIDIKASLKEKEKKRKKAERAERARKKRERKKRGSAQDRVAERLKKMREEREMRLSQAAAEQEKAEEDDREQRRKESEEAEKRRADAEKAEKAKISKQKSAADHPARGLASKSLEKSFSDLSDISESDFVPGLYAAKRKKELEEKRLRQSNQERDDEEQDDEADVVKMPRNPTLEGLRGGENDLSDTLGGTGVMIGSVEGPAAAAIGFSANTKKPLSPSKMSFSAYAEFMKAPVDVPNAESADAVGDDDEEDRTPESTLERNDGNVIADIAENVDDQGSEPGPETVSPDVSPRVSQEASMSATGDKDSGKEKESDNDANMMVGGEDTETLSKNSNKNNNNDEEDLPEGQGKPQDDIELTAAAKVAKSATSNANPTTASQELYVARKAQRDRWNIANGIPPSPMREPEPTPMPAPIKDESKPKSTSADKESNQRAEKQPTGFFSQLKEIKEEVASQIAPSAKPASDSTSPPRGPPLNARGASPGGSPGPPPPPPPPRASTSRMMPPRSTSASESSSWAQSAAAAQIKRESSGVGIRRVQNVGGTPVPSIVQQAPQHLPQESSAMSLSPSTVSAVHAAQYGQIPPLNAGTEGAAANVNTAQNIAPEMHFNNRAEALAWEIREARLEEELDRAHTKLEEMGNLLVRKNEEIARVRDGAAHHRQRAVEARLELQELKGSSGLRNSRLRKSAQLEKEKRLAERSFQGMMASTEKKSDADATEVYDAPPTAAELRDIEREMQLQETLIKGYQRENERLVKEARDVKAKAGETQRRMFEEHERLSATLNNLRNRMVSAAGEEGAVAVRAASDGENLGGNINTALTIASTASKLEIDLAKDAQIAQLKDDLAESKRVAKEALKEHKLEVQELHRELRAVKDQMLNVRMAAIEAGQNSAADSTTVALLQADLEAERRRHNEAEEALQRRITFFAENQEILDRKDGEVAQQKETINKLKQRLVSLEKLARSKIGESAVDAAVNQSQDRSSSSSIPSPNRGGSRSLRDIKRIKELEEQLAEMAEAMRKRNPNSVAALLHASEPPRELTAERDMLASKVSSLENELKSINEVHASKMRSFRQEHERMRAEYEKALSRNPSISATPSRRLKSGVSTPAPKKITMEGTGVEGSTPDASGPKEGESQDDVQRRWYQKKIQEMQRKCEAQVRAAKRGSSSEDIEMLQRKIRSQEKEIEKMREELVLKFTEDEAKEDAAAASTAGKKSAASVAAALKRAKDLHERDILAQAEEHQVTVGRLRMELLATSKSLAAARSEIHTLSLRVKETPSDSSSSVKPASDMMHDNHLKEELAVANNQVKYTKAQLDDCSRRLDESRSHVTQLTGELFRLRAEAAAPVTPAIARISTLEQKIEQMQSRYRARELELQNVVDAVSQRSREETVALQRRHDIAIATKNAEVQRFRQELDALLYAVKAAKRRKQQAKQQQERSP